VNYAKKLLAEVGLDPARLEMYFLSSAEGKRFAELATAMTERARQLGPNPLKNGTHSDTQPTE
jgi:coenzyme F420-reducing hydrogenase delta subunit